MKKSILDEKVENGYFLDLGKIIENSFDAYKKTFLISGGVFLLLSIVMLLFYLVYFGVFYGFDDLTKTLGQLNKEALDPKKQIINTVFGVFLGAVFTPITAGFIYINHLARTNRDFGFESFFTFYKSDKLKDLLLSQFIIILFTNSIATVFMIYNQPMIGVLIQIGVSLSTIFTLPLIIFGNQNYVQAITKSAQLFIKHPFTIILALLIGAVGAVLGLFVLCIGMFFTIPFYFAIHYAIYENGIGIEETNTSEEGVAE